MQRINYGIANGLVSCWHFSCFRNRKILDSTQMNIVVEFFVVSLILSYCGGGGTWIHSLCKNEFIDLYIKKKRRRTNYGIYWKMKRIINLKRKKEDKILYHVSLMTWWNLPIRMIVFADLCFSLLSLISPLFIIKLIWMKFLFPTFVYFSFCCGNLKRECTCVPIQLFPLCNKAAA